MGKLHLRLITFKMNAPVSLPQSQKEGERGLKQRVIALNFLNIFYLRKGNLKNKVK